MRDLIAALALCHNVTPVYPDEKNKSIKEFQASSPDEVALVSFADSLGMQLVQRDQNQIVIKNAAGNMEVYNVLVNFPFSSETKRMGIVLKHIASGRIIFYLKGADTIMYKLLKSAQRDSIIGAVD